VFKFIRLLCYFIIYDLHFFNLKNENINTEYDVIPWLEMLSVQADIWHKAKLFKSYFIITTTYIGDCIDMRAHVMEVSWNVGLIRILGYGLDDRSSTPARDR